MENVDKMQTHICKFKCPKGNLWIIAPAAAALRVWVIVLMSVFCGLCCDKCSLLPWCETPGSPPWSRCGQRCRGRCEGWFPSAAGRAVCPVHNNRVSYFLNAETTWLESYRGTWGFKGEIKMYGQWRGGQRLKRGFRLLSCGTNLPDELMMPDADLCCCRASVQRILLFPLKIYKTALTAVEALNSWNQLVWI